MNFYGTARAVREQVEPFLELGVTDVLFYNTAGMGGSASSPVATPPTWSSRLRSPTSRCDVPRDDRRCQWRLPPSTYAELCR